MGAGRDPVDRVLDVLVSAPLCTAIAARDTVPVLARAARRGLAAAARVLLVEDDSVPVSSAADAPSPPVGDHSGEHHAVEPEESAVVDASSLPIDGYDHLAARQVVDRLAGLTPDELALVAAHERAHRHRRTVLGKIEQLAGS